MKQIPLIIDADTGIDDAVAIAFSCYTKNINLLLISSVAGNVSVDDSTRNNLDILNMINKPEIVVAKGSGKNFSGNTINVSAHGKSGLGEFKFPSHTLNASETSAIHLMHNCLQNSVEPVTILALGPLSNIAELFNNYPEDKQKIKQIVISGGLIEENTTEPYLSFNIAKDSVASEMVFNAGVKITIVPSNLGHEAYLNWQDVYKTKNMNKTGAMFEEIFRSYHDRHVKNGIATHDLCACLYLTHPVHFVKEHALVELKNHNNLKYLSFNFNTSSPNVIVATKCNVKNLKRVYFKTLKLMP